MKRGLMRRLEGSLYTLQLPEEQYSFIDTGVEEEKADSAAVEGKAEQKASK